jgi:DNA primase
MFSKSTLDEIRDRVSIASLVGERIPLKRSGRNFKANCPFHKEKTPSFMVSDDKGIYHCFGCGEGGDVFEFVKKFDGVSFSDAVRYIASKAGIEVEEERDSGARAREEEASRRRRLFLRVNEIAREHFQGRLAEPQAGSGAREYLQSRGITDEYSKQHMLGLADDSWDRLTAKLSEKNVPLELAEQLGLLKKRDSGGYYDFFRGRLMFPILTPRGETIGFGGRALSDGGDAAKYINSPDSPIYHKSASVYGLDRSAGAIRSSDQVVLVEGYMDFIALHQSGIENVAAPLGTALTQGHVSMLARYTRNMVLVFDGDEAGKRACMRALAVFIDSGIMPRVVVLPAGEDPDSVVRNEGADAMRARIERARPLFEYFVEIVVQDTGLDSAGKGEALRRIVPMLRRVTDPVDASVLKQHLVRRLDVAEDVIERALRAGGRSTNVAVASAPVKSTVDATATSAERIAERLLVETVLRHPEVVSDVFGRVGPANLSDEWCRTVAGLIVDEKERSEKFDVRELIEGLDDDELAAQMRAIALGGEGIDEEGEGGEEVATLISDCANIILSRPARARIEEINDDIRRAENEGDEERMLKLLAEKKDLVERVNARGD